MAARANDAGLALILKGFERTRPEEQPVALLGRTRLEQTGTKATVVLETEKDDRYAIASWCEDPLTFGIGHEAWIGRKVLLGGILTGERTARGDPIVRVDNIRWGSEVDPLQTSPASALPRPNLIPKALPVLEGQARIKKASLIFFALPIPRGAQARVSDDAYRLVLPAYRFEGSTLEGDSFVVYVQAYIAPNQ